MIQAFLKRALLFLSLFGLIACQNIITTSLYSSCGLATRYDTSSTNQLGVSDPNMTNEACAKICSYLNFKFSSTYQGTQCLCLPLIGRGYLFALNSSYCPYSCSGNSSDTCGGLSYDYIQMINTNTTSPSYLQSECVYSNKSDTFQNLTSGYYFNPMNSTLCVNSCYGSSYSYVYLMQQYSECLCSNFELFEPLPSTWPSYCGLPCLGNTNEPCGNNAYALTVTQITYTGNYMDNYVEYSGCYQTLNILGRVFFTLTSSQVKVSQCIQACQAMGYSYGYLMGLGLIAKRCTCNSNLTQYTLVADSNCKTRRVTMADGSYTGLTNYFGLYTFKGFNGVIQSVNESYISYVGCYSNSVADLIYVMPNITNLKCAAFCAQMNYVYAATKITTCYCGSDPTTIGTLAVGCTSYCSDNTTFCGGSAVYFSLYKINSLTMVISCLSQTAYQFDTVACSLSLTYFTNAVVNINPGNGNIQTLSVKSANVNSTQTFSFDISYSQIGSYNLTATAVSDCATPSCSISTVVWMIINITHYDPPLNTGALYNVVNNNEMSFIQSNAISTTMNSNRMSCAALCNSLSFCRSFVIKPDLNCTLFYKLSSSLVSSPGSKIYIKQ